MAKRGRRPASESGATNPTIGATSRMEEFAEDLGRLLGTARAKAEGWLGQRQNVAKQLEQIRDTATGLLNQLPGCRNEGAQVVPEPRNRSCRWERCRRNARNERSQQKHGGPIPGAEEALGEGPERSLIASCNVCSATRSPRLRDFAVHGVLLSMRE